MTDRDIMIEAKNIVVDCIIKGNGQLPELARIRRKYNELQTKDGKWEKTKDLWAELYIRVYRGHYLLRRVVLPGICKILDEDMPDISAKADYKDSFNIMDKQIMVDVYSRRVNELNERIYKLRLQWMTLAEDVQDKDIQDQMLQAVELFDAQVIPCVSQNMVNINRYKDSSYSVTPQEYAKELANIRSLDDPALSVKE